MVLKNYIKLFNSKSICESVAVLFSIFGKKHVAFSFNEEAKLVHCFCKHRHFENTKLLAGNDHVIDIFNAKDMQNISVFIFSILLYTIMNWQTFNSS